MATSTAFAAPVYQGYGQAIAEERFEPAGFKLALGLKDLRLAQEAAEQVHVPLQLAGVLRDAHIESLARGEGQLDWAACRARRRGGPGWSKASGRAAPDQAGAASACRRHRGKPQVIFLSPRRARPRASHTGCPVAIRLCWSRRRDRR